MAGSRTAKLAALTCAALLLAACGLQPVRIPPAAERGLPPLGSSEFDTLTQHNDPQRSGAYLAETRLNPATVGHAGFERLFDWEVDGQIYTQPLYVSHLPYGGKLINLVVVATTNNSVYAFAAPAADSDVQPAAAPLWHVGSDQLGAPLRYDFFLIDWGVMGHNIKPLIGITATPVIDRQRGLVYVTVKSGSGGIFGFLAHARYRLFAINLVTGKIESGTDIDASYTGPDHHTTKFVPQYQLQRAGMLEANDRIYLAFGSHQDTRPYHGWLLAYDADTLQQVNAYCTTCDNTLPEDDCSDQQSCMGGIWQAGAGPATDEAGHIYVMSGNGTYNSRGDLGTSFIKLDKDLHVVGAWTPAEHDCLNRTDADLGSAGPTYLAGQSILVGGGKEGLLYALDSGALQGARLEPGKPGKRDPCEATDPIPDPGGAGSGYWSIQATPRWNEDGIMDALRKIDPSVASQGYHHIHGAPVHWTVRGPQGEHLLLYVSAERDVLRAFEFDHGFIGASQPGDDPKDTFHSRCPNSGTGMPGGFLTLSANQGDPGSGIVWAAMPRWDRDALNHTVRGVLRAYQAYPDSGNELKEIWNSDGGARATSPGDCKDAGATGNDQLGDFAKFVPPTVAEGEVYVSTFSHRLVAYGINQPVRIAHTGAPQKSYDAKLEIGPAPASVEPGKPIAVSIAATNTGDAAWRIEDDIELGSQTIAASVAKPTEGLEVLKVQREVPPGETYTFAFHLTAPDEEETRAFSWRLVRKGGATKQPTGQWFGSATQEWEFDTLQSACDDLRARARTVTSQIKVDKVDPNALRGEILAIKQESETRKCSLSTGIGSTMMGH